MAAGEGDFIVVTWYHAHFREQGTGGLVTGVRGRGGVCDPLTFQVGYFMDVGIDVGVDLKRVAELPGVRAHQGEGHRTGQINRERRWAGRKARHMQTTAAHGFHLRGVGLHGEEANILACHFRQMIDEGLPDVGIDGGVFNRRVGKDQSVGIHPL